MHFHDINHSVDWKHTFIFQNIRYFVGAPNWCKFFYAHHLSGSEFGKRDTQQEKSP